MTSTPRALLAASPATERFARDLTSLLSLPAFWSGRDPAFVLDTLMGALESLLPIVACYGRATIEDAPPIVVLRAARQPVGPEDLQWQPLVSYAEAEPARESRHRFETVGGVLAVFSIPMGYMGEVGRVAVAAARADFPDAAEEVTLRAAVTLAATGLETARVIAQRDRAQRAKDEFLAMLGHELRNPLAPILTALKLMALRAGGTRSREELVIERQVTQLRLLVDDLLDVSRIARGQFELHLASVPVAGVLAAALDTVSPLLEERRHQVTVDAEPDLVVDADESRLTQILTNLLTNAAKYTPSGGHIAVTAARDGEAVAITVRDSGIGLRPELLPRVFDMFVQGPRGLARSEGGLGIGLTLVKTLVEAHGGSVSASSDGPDRGSRFSVRLPRRADTPMAAPSAAPLPAAAAGTPLRVLVVDDNEDAAELSRTLIETVGHAVQVAFTGKRAVAAAVAWHPDIVLLDIGLPELDGYGVAREISVRCTPVPAFIAVSGYGRPRDHLRSREAGFAAHLVKPVDPERLLATLAAVAIARRAAPDATRGEGTL